MGESSSGELVEKMVRAGRGWGWGWGWGFEKREGEGDREQGSGEGRQAIRSGQVGWCLSGPELG